MSVILQASNYDLLKKGKPLTYLTDLETSGSGTIDVESITGFSLSDWIAIGVLGEERTEIIKVHASTAPSGSTVTLASNLVHDHEKGAPVYVVDYDQIEWSRATTETGSKSILATNSLAPDSMVTIYDDTTNTSGFGFYRFKNSAAATYSPYSDAIPYAGYDENTAHEIFERALSAAGEELSPRLRNEHLYKFLNDFISIANSRNRKWSEGKVYGEEIATLATGDWEASLPSGIARKHDPSAIMGIRISRNLTLRYKSPQEFNYHMQSLSYTTANGTISDVDTTIVLTNSSPFDDSGTIYINGDEITYTGNIRSTNTLTGVSGIASGGHATGSYVFQNYISGIPQIYTIPSSGTIRFWPIADSTVNNEVIYCDYFKSIPRVNSVGDTILLADPRPAIDYVAYRIKKFVSGGTLSTGDEDYQQFLYDIKQMIDQDSNGEPLKVRIG